MIIVGTYNSLPISKYIRHVFDSKASHIAFVFDDKFVVHSKLPTGVELDWKNSFFKHTKEAWAIDVPGLPLEKEEEIFQGLLDAHDGDGYDFGAGLFLGIHGFAHKYLGRELPKENKWGSGKMPLCTSLWTRLPEWFRGEVNENEIEMMTPDAVGGLIKARIEGGIICL